MPPGMIMMILDSEKVFSFLQELSGLEDPFLKLYAEWNNEWKQSELCIHVYKYVTEFECIQLYVNMDKQWMILTTLKHVNRTSQTQTNSK